MGVLDNRAVVITGAGRGLGRAYASVAAQEGAAVVVNDIDPDEAEQTVADIRVAGGTAVVAAGSVARWDEAEAIVARCVAEFGSIDGLVNNAGLFYVTQPWEDSEEQILSVIQANLIGTMNCGIHAMKRMKAQGHGSIVNITSGAQSGLSRMAAYGATKGAVASLTYSWALDLMAHNVRVNAVSPIAGTRMGEYLRGQGGATGPGWPPERVAPLVAYLLSDLSATVTGQVVRLAGELLAVVGHPTPVQPSTQKATWSLNDINEAFKTTLNLALQPIAMPMSTYAWEGPTTLAASS